MRWHRHKPSPGWPASFLSSDSETACSAPEPLSGEHHSVIVLAFILPLTAAEASARATVIISLARRHPEARPSTWLLRSALNVTLVDHRVARLRLTTAPS